MTAEGPFYHGGIPDLRPGDLILPGHDRRLVEGCPTCEARARGESLIDPPSSHIDRIYITSDRDYARYYASLYGHGDLYSVDPIGDMISSEEDHFPTWAVESAKVRSVYQRYVLLTPTERRRLYRKWGKADERAGAA